MKLNELYDAILKIIPKATISEDNDYQIIIHTNLIQIGDELEDMDE